VRELNIMESRRPGHVRVSRRRQYSKNVGILLTLSHLIQLTQTTAGQEKVTEPAHQAQLNAAGYPRMDLRGLAQ